MENPILWGLSKDLVVTLVWGVVTVVGFIIAAVAKVQVSRNDARILAAEERAEDHEERLEKLEPVFGDSLDHIRDLRGHINRGDPPPPPPLPGSLVHYYFD